MITIAVDAMGGDDAPRAIIEGAAITSLEGGVQVLLVGSAPVIQSHLSQLRHEAELISVRHASQVVPMDARPGEALAALPDASISVAARLVAAGEADALVTAGSTGAAILAASQHWKRLPGIHRAALAAVYPTQLPHGPKKDPFALLLDVGATVSATSDDLIRFALLGHAYAQVVSANPAPRIALLSNGSEAVKGTPAIVEAHARLAGLPWLSFVGNVEGLDIPIGSADVIVTDGFVGNVVLKMFEGVSEVARRLARDASNGGLRTRLGVGLLASDLRQLKDLTDWKVYGGAPVLGFERLLIKAHGRSNPRAVRNAIRVAAKAVRGELIPRTAALLSRLPMTSEGA